MQPLRLLIVDDEPLIRTGLRQGLAKLEHIEVLGECGSGAEAVDAILAQQPDLVLLDVQLPDCTGLEVVRQVGVERMPMVIFATAYDEYALKAFELNAVDYLLKPFDDERLARSIARARERIERRSDDSLARQLHQLLSAQERGHVERLVVRNGSRYEFVSVDTIDWIESADNYVQLHCGPRSLLHSETLSALEEKLDPRRFTRVHRRKIINLSRIRAVHPIVNGTYELEMQNGLRLATGRQYRDTIQTLLRS
jgi:two-component system, LytTR family, response regulator